MNAIVLSNATMRRATVIAQRTNSVEMGVIKAMQIETLKAKLQSGVAHFEYVKKNGEIREAWGTTCSNLMKAKVYGGGIRRDFVNCVVYWDVEVGDFRSLRFENLVKVY
jgi:hypothetical protein